MEEGLRLMSLPGEDQGRAYYFRSLRVTGLPPDGDRVVWQAKFQEAFNRKAAQAVHGTDSHAGFADAVFFRSEQEALEMLLHRTLARHPAQEWFWPMVIGEPGGTGNAQPSVLDVVERLRAQPASWVAFAVSLFAVPGFDAVRLLRAIPEPVIAAWIREMDEVSRPVSLASALGSAGQQQPAVRRALEAFGPANPGVVWLAALAVLLDSPSDLASGVAVSKARLGLQRLAKSLGIPSNEDAPPAKKTFTADSQRGNISSESAQERHEENIDSVLPRDAHRLDLPQAMQPGRTSEPVSALEPVNAASELSSPNAEPSAHIEDNSPAINTNPSADSEQTQLLPDWQEAATPLPWLVSGVQTHAAGLFFLLNVMQQLGIAESHSLLAGVPQFVPRVLLCLARQSSATGDDPILAWLRRLVANSATGNLPQPLESSFLPANLPPSLPIASTEDLVRAWSVAVRRWCWHLARLRAGEIIDREGVFFVNRTDLDVSLPMEAVDVRIRKAGLDLDPGWLPWFGLVVRFHYLFRGELYG
jgi:hypothetical protein